MPTQVLTRQQYLHDQTVSHEDYFAQFVTEETLRAVRNVFDAEQLSEALDEDRHLNTIPLRKWETLAIHEIDSAGLRTFPRDSGRFYAGIPFNREAAKEANEAITRSTLVCIAKRAARTVVGQHKLRLVAAAA